MILVTCSYFMLLRYQLVFSWFIVPSTVISPRNFRRYVLTFNASPASIGLRTLDIYVSPTNGFGL